MRRVFPLLLLIILTACVEPPSALDADRQVVAVYVDEFTEAWLPALYTCAERTPELLVSRTPDIDSANLVLRLIRTPETDGVAYQLGNMEFFVAINAENTVVDLTFDDVQAIYAGKIYNWSQLGGDDTTIQVWAYRTDAGVNDILLGDGTLSSLAKQAQSPEAMRDAVAENPSGIGFLPREEMSEIAHIQYITLDQSFILPLLAIVSEEDQSALSLIQCLQ